MSVARANTMLATFAGAAQRDRAFRDRERDRHAMLDVLAWLWDVVAEPVLTALGHSGPPGHAIGGHGCGGVPPDRLLSCRSMPRPGHPRHRSSIDSANSVLDRVISSYTPTLTALAHTRQAVTSGPARQLAVGMPTTPGLSPLPAVPEEMEILGTLLPARPGNYHLTESQATRQRPVNWFPATRGCTSHAMLGKNTPTRP